MSVSKYRWTPACDARPCPGDCDLCSVQDTETFGDRLRHLREQKGISQYRAAKEMGIHKNMLYRYEAGTSTPNTFFLEILADFYGVSMDYLWRGYEK